MIPTWEVWAALVCLAGVPEAARGDSPRSHDPRLARTAAAPDLAAPEDQNKAEAKRLVRAANEAFGRGELAQAIALYEEAMLRRPSPKLHYNIGVCRERMMEDAASSDERTRLADAAIEAYNHYLQENPRAADRVAVADRIRALGGTPTTDVGLKSVFDGPGESDDSGESHPAPESEPKPEPEPNTETTQASPPARLKFAVNLSVGGLPQLADVQQVEADTLGALSASGGAFVGSRRRLLLGLGIGIYSGGGTDPTSYAFLGGHLGPIIDITSVLGSERRVELSMGMIAAVARQSIHTRAADAPHPVCSDRANTRIGARNGFFGAGRFSFAVLIGRRRAHAITLDLQPGIAAFAADRAASDCAPGQTPFAARGINAAPLFVLLGGLGYALRF